VTNFFKQILANLKISSFDKLPFPSSSAIYERLTKWVFHKKNTLMKRSILSFIVLARITTIALINSSQFKNPRLNYERKKIIEEPEKLKSMV